MVAPPQTYSSRRKAMDANRKAAAGGLEGVVVADTRLSDVDGERGRLTIAGRDVEELAGRASFEDAAALLWGVDAAAARAGLAEGRALAHGALAQLGDALERPDGMDALRASTAHLSEGAPARVA